MNNIDSKHLKQIIENYNEPVLFKGYINQWKILKWTLNDWDNKLGNKLLQFRKYNFIKSSSPIWEQICSITHITMKDFIKFQNEHKNNSWLYFDYKYMQEWFQNHTDILNDISWTNFGYCEKSGKDSTIWIGSKGAHTPCHTDTYGCNLIAQIYGRKKWIIFPPTEDLKPIRVPYEESSVYSKLNFFCPSVNQFKGVQNARIVVLNPGEVLFMPTGWWHYVENLETAISVNIWLPQPQDDKKRVEEAFTQLLVAQLTKILDRNEQSMILNPNSTDVTEISLSNSLSLLDKVVEIYGEQNLKENKENNDLDIKRIIDEEGISIELIPKLTENDFLTIIKEQEEKCSNYPELESDEQKSNNVTTIKKIINAVCHPDVLKLIAEKLINDD